MVIKSGILHVRHFQINVVLIHSSLIWDQRHHLSVSYCPSLLICGPISLNNLQTFSFLLIILLISGICFVVSCSSFVRLMPVLYLVIKTNFCNFYVLQMA